MAPGMRGNHPPITFLAKPLVKQSRAKALIQAITIITFSSELLAEQSRKQSRQSRRGNHVSPSPLRGWETVAPHPTTCAEENRPPPPPVRLAQSPSGAARQPTTPPANLAAAGWCQQVPRSTAENQVRAASDQDRHVSVPVPDVNK